MLLCVMFVLVIGMFEAGLCDPGVFEIGLFEVCKSDVDICVVAKFKMTRVVHFYHLRAREPHEPPPLESSK